jgi:hypothetical protein
MSFLETQRSIISSYFFINRPGSVGIQEGAEGDLVDEDVDESVRRLPQLRVMSQRYIKLYLHLIRMYSNVHL